MESFFIEKQDWKGYQLPMWRVNEIILLAAQIVCSQKNFDESFDYKKMISDMGIKIKKFSSFTDENLSAFYQSSLSLWKEGVCFVLPYQEETGKKVCMIVYNDKKSSTECMEIILHEFAHIVMRHTQQSINGELEATCFALAMIIFIELEKQYHKGKELATQINYLRVIGGEINQKTA